MGQGQDGVAVAASGAAAAQVGGMVVATAVCERPPLGSSGNSS